VVATIDIVAHEQVVGVGRLSADLEQLHEVVELAVDVAANCHRTLHFLNVRLLRQNLASLTTKPKTYTLEGDTVMRKAVNTAVTAVITDLTQNVITVTTILLHHIHHPHGITVKFFPSPRNYCGITAGMGKIPR